jgi:hypothetical protein
VNQDLNTVYPVNTTDRVITLLALGLLLGAIIGPGIYCHNGYMQQAEDCFTRCGGSAVVTRRNGCSVDQCLCVSAPDPIPKEVP